MFRMAVAYLFAPLVLVLALSESSAFAGTTTVTPVIPLPGALIPFEPGHKVLFSATVLLDSRAVFEKLGGPWLRLTITRKDGGPSIVRYPAPGKIPIVSEEIPVEEFLALVPRFTEKQPFEWTLVVGTQKYKDTWKESLVSASREFTLAAPPDLAVGVDTELGSPWPKRVVVRNVGGSKSQPSSLEITFRLRDASDPAARNRCAPLDYHQVHTLLALDPNDQKAFDIPKPPGTAPAARPAGVHKVVTCNYAFDASLSKDTNKADPNTDNDGVRKTVSIDVPLN